MFREICFNFRNLQSAGSIPLYDTPVDVVAVINSVANLAVEKFKKRLLRKILQKLTYLQNTICAKSIDAKIGNSNKPLKIRKCKHYFKYDKCISLYKNYECI
jgi:hypothetical protein